jgi:catechol 2,3-dioxygenase-like lactoylglutathione lyase family enzyme
MTDIRLEHAFLYVASVERSLAFYRALFPGWGIRWSGDNGSGGSWVHFGPPDRPGELQPSYLSLCDAPADLRPGDARIKQAAHLGFAHPDVDGVKARVAASGVEATDRIDDGRYRRVYFEDPDGYELELVQRL